MELINANNRAETCLRDWHRDHTEYFHGKNLAPETYAEALESFVSYLRQKKLTYAEASIEFETEGVRWFYLSLHMSIMFSAFLTIYTELLHNNNNETLKYIKMWPGLFLVGFAALCIFVPVLTIRKDSHMLAMSERKFLQIALRRYLFLYEGELGTKTVETKRGKWANIPLNAESIYGAKMRLSIHYDHIFLIRIKDTDRTYQYTWYTDSNYSTMNENTQRIFVELCKQQTGRNWSGTDVQKFSLEKLV